MRTPQLAAPLLLLCCAAATAAPRELVMLAPLNHPLPIARFTGTELTGGILKDLGDLMAAKLGRTARYVAVPSRRVALMLARGEADGVCLVQPHWIDGDFRWSAPLIPTGGVVLARADAPVIARLEDLRGKKVGTVPATAIRSSARCWDATSCATTPPRPSTICASCWPGAPSTR